MCGFMFVWFMYFLFLAEIIETTAYVTFSPHTQFGITKNLSSHLVFERFTARFFWPVKLVKLASDLYLKWAPLPLMVYHGRYYQKAVHTGYFHWHERVLAGCLKRKYLHFKELWCLFFFEASVPFQSFHESDSFSSTLYIHLTLTFLYHLITKRNPW